MGVFDSALPWIGCRASAIKLANIPLTIKTLILQLVLNETLEVTARVASDNISLQEIGRDIKLKHRYRFKPRRC